MQITNAQMRHIVGLLHDNIGACRLMVVFSQSDEGTSDSRKSMEMSKDLLVHMAPYLIEDDDNDTDRIPNRSELN